MVGFRTWTAGGKKGDSSVMHDQETGYCTETSRAPLPHKHTKEQSLEEIRRRAHDALCRREIREKRHELYWGVFN